MCCGGCCKEVVFFIMGIMPIMNRPTTFQAGDVCTLTGLSSHQLREWTLRRGILLADQPAQGRGRHARYAWNTVLVLRVLAQLHRDYGIEIGAWSALATALRDDLAFSSPVGLYGRFLLVCGSQYEITTSPSASLQDTALIVRLDPHVEALAAGLGLPPPLAQRDLFPVVRA